MDLSIEGAIDYEQALAEAEPEPTQNPDVNQDVRHPGAVPDIFRRQALRN